MGMKVLAMSWGGAQQIGKRKFDRDSAGDAKTIGELMGGIQLGGSSDAMCAHWTVISDDRGMENRSF
jgi:hypothetical protein